MILYFIERCGLVHRPAQIGDKMEKLFNLDKEMIHRSQNDELMFYRQVASGDMEAIQENCNQHRFLDHEGVGVLSRDPVLNLKYHFIVTAALVSRICTENGMEMEMSFRLSDYYIQNASFLKCDNITLGYSFDSLFGLKASGRVYATAQNVFTITDYKGLDPEINGGYDGNIYPRPFVGIIGVNLNF